MAQVSGCSSFSVYVLCSFKGPLYVYFNTHLCDSQYRNPCCHSKGDGHAREFGFRLDASVTVMSSSQMPEVRGHSQPPRKDMNRALRPKITSHEAALAIIEDLFTIRVDRDKHYCGADALFQRHPDIIKALLSEALLLLPKLLDGLIWRCRTLEKGQRRAHDLIKHLLIGPDGKFAKALQWISKSKDRSHSSLHIEMRVRRR